MARLAAQVRTLARLFPPGGRVAYLDLPLHGNVGDLLIYLGTERFLAEQQQRVVLRTTCAASPARIARRIGTGDLICLHGGGNFGDLYPAHQEFRRAVVERFPDNRIVVMPQTVHFGDGSLWHLLEPFRRHRRLTVCVRDRTSARALAEAGIEDVVLVPDMAHLLWRNRPDGGGGGRLHLLRRDQEAPATAGPEATAPAAVCDWGDLIHPVERRCFRLLQIAARRHLPVAPLWQPLARRLARRAERLLARHDHVVTDRLHGVILSALLSRRVTALDNSYGKVSAYVDLWLDRSPLVARK
ncbi:polysaccharide pyruvyl transferase family protein [Rhodospirillum centenum]|uniref:Polysaccharide pyruvyl transferase superfamily n=1 Tax=Rhodospirillum centenum (strain ATCC 51521 / SW) TaxID=414684 RepID=B6IQF6_RHOCS|nr:polysaccharide pyruvyl transferase family protein [Rhodospirillum centenum]ACI97692.1 polysaccharide pyruvyl transferase superfamily [Rhodospirillum centenum SW]